MLKPALILLMSCVAALAGEVEDLQQRAAESLRKGVAFFRDQVAVEGTYLWQYSADLSKREGEGKATATQGWVQPPGTPAVGMVLLHAWEATSNSYYLEAARTTARGLVKGQLRSGGWHYAVDFDEASRKKVAYRMERPRDRARNVTTFDDDTTQAALRFLIRFDRASEFKDPEVRSAVDYAVTSILKAQYPNGGWPQGYDSFPNPADFPVKKAAVPETWTRSWPGSQQYWLRYTLNDNLTATLIETLLEIAQIYVAPATTAHMKQMAADCRAAALRTGDFLLLAQLPEPQPAWAQQYDANMHPSWARKFEPPAVTGGESQRALRTLIALYRNTGETKYLDPVPRALDYLRRSRLADGQLARFYELRSNKPLYFTRDYQLTYSDTDLPTHYSFKVKDETDQIASEYERAKATPAAKLKVTGTRSRHPKQTLLVPVQEIIAAQDSRGAWVEKGRLKSYSGPDAPDRVIRSSTFIRNVELLSEFVGR